MEMQEALLTRISLRQDEVLFVRVPGRMLSPTGQEELRKQIGDLFPGRKVCVIAKEIEFAAAKESVVPPAPPPPTSDRMAGV